MLTCLTDGHERQSKEGVRKKRHFQMFGRSLLSCLGHGTRLTEEEDILGGLEILLLPYVRNGQSARPDIEQNQVNAKQCD